MASPRRRRRHRRPLALPQRRYPARQARCLLLGLLSAGLPAGGSRLFCAAGVLRMASARGKLTFRRALKRTVVCVWSSLSGPLAGPGAREAPALGPGCPPGAEEDKGPTAPGPARQEEGRRAPERREPRGRGSDGGGGARSAFRRLVVNGAPRSFVPRPGPLRRDFGSQAPPSGGGKTSRTSWLSSCSKRNAITSSYSSTRGLPAPPRLPGRPAAPPPAPAQKAGGESRPPGPRASAEPPGRGAQEKVAGVAEGQELGWGCSPAPDDGRPRKRRIPLLPRRGGAGRLLPSPPQLGYQVTAEDLDREKRAGLRWIRRVLEG